MSSNLINLFGSVDTSPKAFFLLGFNFFASIFGSNSFFFLIF